MNKVLVTIGVITIMLGIKMIYDARPIVKTYFSFGEENEAVMRYENIGIYHNDDRGHFSVF